MLVKRSIGLGIVIFWCVMNFLFIQRQLDAPPPAIRVLGPDRITESSEEWWGVFFRGEKIGYAAQTIAPRPNGFKLTDRSVLQLNLMGMAQPALTRLELEATEDWILEQFSFELVSNDIRFDVQGRFRDGKLRLEIESAGHRSTREMVLTQAPYLLAALKPYVVTQQLEPGKKFLFSTFDPATLSQQVTTVTIEGRERIQIGDRTEPAIKLRQSFRGISVISWIDGRGRTLKEESPAGLSLLRQAADEARALPGRAVSLDLVAETAIPIPAPLSEAQIRQALKIKLKGVELASFPLLQSGRQTLRGDVLEIRPESLAGEIHRRPMTDPRLTAYLQPTPFLQSEHPEIRNLAARIVAGETDARKAAVKLQSWVHEEIVKHPTVSIPNALEVLRTKKGDCNEHTVLFNALARAAGIPAKTVVGLVYLRGAFYYHAWSEIWLGDWVSLDSVLNQFPADLTHIKFLEGDIDRQIDLLQLIGNLKIEVL